MNKQLTMGRRQMFKRLVLGGAVGVTASVVVGSAIATNRPNEQEKPSAGYRETPHIRAYYASLKHK